MPEGHVIHRLAAELDHAFAGRTVTVSSPQGRFAEASALLDQTVFRTAEAFGKHLILDFSPPVTSETVPEELREEQSKRHDGPHATSNTQHHEGSPATPGPFVHIHLGLIGKLRWVKPDAVDGAGTLRLRIQTDEHAAELRGPQACALVGPEEVAALVAALGPDPLRADADPERGWRRVHRSDRTIASLLMDQRVAAGVGNIYRAEVLYRQRIHPDTPGSALSRRAWNRIWADFVELMPQGVLHGRIDTVRPEDSPEATGRDPRVDRHGGEVYVYRRQGQPCLVCGREVSLRLFEGRNLYWCPRCQRRR
jgi:endonuclease-8